MRHELLVADPETDADPLVMPRAGGAAGLRGRTAAFDLTEELERLLDEGSELGACVHAWLVAQAAITALTIWMS